MGGSNEGHLGFIIMVVFVLGFITFIGASFGATVVSGFETSITPPTAPGSILDVPGFIIGNIVFLFQLTTISSDFALFSLLVVTPFLLGIIYIIVLTVAAFVP